MRKKLHKLCITAFSEAFADSAAVFGCLKAAVVTHDTFLSSVLRFPMSFFWTTPLGRTLARFSNDIRIIDERLSVNFSILVYASIQVCKRVFTEMRSLNVALSHVFMSKTYDSLSLVMESSHKTASSRAVKWIIQCRQKPLKLTQISLIKVSRDH